MPNGRGDAIGEGGGPDGDGAAADAIVSEADALRAQLIRQREHFAARAAVLLQEVETHHHRALERTRAAEATRKTLSFRVGRAIVHNCRSLMGLIRLPYAVISAILAVRRDQKEIAAQGAAGPVRGDPWSPTGAFLSLEPLDITLQAGEHRLLRVSGALEAYGGDLDQAAAVRVSCCDRDGAALAVAAAGWTPAPGPLPAVVRIVAAGLDRPFTLRLALPDATATVTVGVVRHRADRPLRLFLHEAGVVDTAADAGSHMSAAVAPAAGGRPRVASILDEFSAACFAPNLDLVPLSRQRWREQLRDASIDLVLAESAWRGNGGTWRHAFSRFGERHGDDLRELLATARAAGLPRVFWNKEDPPNFEVFLPVARAFDDVFTTDAACVGRYQAMLGHRRIFPLPFAAEPTIHHPVRRGPVNGRYCFAGSWMGVKYPERSRWIDILFAEPLRRGVLDIYDRRAGEEDPSVCFPEPYRRAVKGWLPYRDLVDQTYRSYSAFLNVNSVEDSPTMVSRRVYELLACGTPVISSPSRAIEATFGDLVAIVREAGEVAAVMDRWQADPVARDRQILRGIRLVHSQHTYAHRLEELFARIGRPVSLRAEPRVTVISASDRPERLGHIARQVGHQTWADRDGVFIGLGEEVDLDEAERLLRPAGFSRFVRAPAGRTRTESLAAAIGAAPTDILALISDVDYYGPEYLGDAVRHLTYAPGGLVGKSACFVVARDQAMPVLEHRDEAFRLVRSLVTATLVWDRRRVAMEDHLRRAGDGDRITSDAAEPALFSADYFNYVQVAGPAAPSASLLPPASALDVAWV